MTTIHSFTTDQRILDNSHKDIRRARTASQSIVPTSTGASKTIGEIIPSLKGKLEGVAMRIPTPNVSLIELIFCSKKDLSVEKINSAFKNFSMKQKIKVLEITEEKLVSIDFNHNPASSIVDASLTNVLRLITSAGVVPELGTLSTPKLLSHLIFQFCFLTLLDSKDILNSVEFKI